MEVISRKHERGLTKRKLQVCFYGTFFKGVLKLNNPSKGKKRRRVASFFFKNKLNGIIRLLTKQNGSLQCVNTKSHRSSTAHIAFNPNIESFSIKIKK